MRLVFCCLLVALASLSVASSQPLAPSDSLCTYERCALRIEPGWFGQQIRRGPVEASERVGSVWFTSDLATLVQEVPAAYAQARSADRSRLIAIGAIIAGSLVYGYALGPPGERVDDSRAIVGGLTGIGLVVTGSVLGLQAQRQQSRAVWEYNRALATSPAR